MKTDPRTGRPYRKDAWKNLAVVIDLLEMVDSPVLEDIVTSWTDEEIHAAGDWALRSYYRASDNLNRVPPKPECVRLGERPRQGYGNTATVMDIVAGDRP